MWNLDNFHSLEVVDRVSETQLQVSENFQLNNLAVKRLTMAWLAVNGTRSVNTDHADRSHRLKWLAAFTCIPAALNMKLESPMMKIFGFMATQCNVSGVHPLPSLLVSHTDWCQCQSRSVRIPQTVYCFFAFLSNTFNWGLPQTREINLKIYNVCEYSPGIPFHLFTSPAPMFGPKLRGTGSNTGRVGCLCSKLLKAWRIQCSFSW